MRRRALLLLCMWPLAAVAAPREELSQTQEALKASQAVQEKLSKQEAALEKELEALKEKLVRATTEMQKSDTQLNDMRSKLQNLEAALAKKEQAFFTKRQKLDGLSRVAIRLSRTPPQAMVLMPGDGKDRIQAAHALSLVTAEIKRESETIQADMATLRTLKTKVEAEKQKTEKIQVANRAQKKAFEAILKDRKSLRDRLVVNRTQEDAKIAELARKARSLQELVDSLNVKTPRGKKTAAGKEVTAEAGTAGSRGKLRDFSSAKGRLRVPVTGRVAEGFGDKDGKNDTHKGVTIVAQRGATVVTTFDAEVAYTGTFLNYGKLVILKHRGDYHTLLAGLSRIDVNEGEFLLEGEPIGAMGSSENEQLYVELRENNQPINPEKWIRGL